MEKENEKIAASRLNDKIAMRLKERRQKLGLSQGKLAEICGWTQSRIGNYEAGSRNVGVHDAVVLGKALGISPPELLFGEQESSELWLNESQRKLLELFNQLPGSEQQRMIELFEVRLKEIDEYVEKYLRGRLKDNPHRSNDLDITVICQSARHQRAFLYHHHMTLTTNTLRVDTRKHIVFNKHIQTTPHQRTVGQYLELSSH